MLNGSFFGTHFYSLEEIEMNLKLTYDFVNEINNLTNEGDIDSIPKNAIKTDHYINKKWIPLCDDGSDNSIGIDLDPDING